MNGCFELEIILSEGECQFTFSQTGIPRIVKCPNSTVHCFEKQSLVFLRQYLQECLMVYHADYRLYEGGDGEENKLPE